MGRIRQLREVRLPLELNFVGPAKRKKKFPRSLATPNILKLFDSQKKLFLKLQLFHSIANICLNFGARDIKICYKSRKKVVIYRIVGRLLKAHSMKDSSPKVKRIMNVLVQRTSF